jgi:hypothetical protein
MRGIGVSSVLLRASRPLIAFMLVAAPIALLVPQNRVSPAAQQDGGPVIVPDRDALFFSPEQLRAMRTPIVSPDRMEDVIAIRSDFDGFPIADNFAWRAFIALNWPSLTDPAHRGVPDLAKKLGDPGPRVWETFKARYELFQTGSDSSPIAPKPWNTYDAANPCGAGVDGSAKTLASFDPFMDFNQFEFGKPANPLIAQNGTYTRYETRVNDVEYSALAFSDWSQGQKLLDEFHPAEVPEGSIAVKAAWRLLTAADTPKVRARYYVVKNANVVDVAKTRAAGHVVCSKSDVALVGMHMVIRTLRRPQGVWFTFEHVDNVPPAGAGEAREPDAKDAGVPYSYFDPSKPKLGLSPKFGSPSTLPVSSKNPPQIHPVPMQVVRRHPIHLSTMKRNRSYWALPGIKGTIWEHYMLVANQWPTFALIDPHNDGIYFPEARKENMVNTMIETYFQDAPSSCMACHQAFNAQGHNFVGMLGSFH